MTLNSANSKSVGGTLVTTGANVTGGRRNTSLNFMPYVMSVKARKGGDLDGLVEALKKGDYQVPNHDVIKNSRGQRVAHLLAWCALNYPGVFVPWNYIHMTVNANSKPLAARAEEVLAFRNTGSAAERALMKHYDLCLWRGPELNVRATRTNDHGEDIGRTVLKAANKKLLRAHDNVLRRLTLIKQPAKIADPEIRKFVLDTATAIKKSMADDMLKKLLPPGDTQKKKKPA